MFGVYSVLVLCYTAIASVRRRVLIFFGRGSSGELNERLGLSIPSAMASGNGIVLNAVSVGEVAAVESLVGAIRALSPGTPVLITTGNRDGRSRAERLRQEFESGVAVSYLPWDRSGILRPWLRRLNPSAVVMIEVELWPNLFRSCRDLGIPVFVVSGRIYERDIPRYRFARRFFRHVLSCVSWIGVQSEEQRDRFIAIGANPKSIDVAGDLKMAPPLGRGQGSDHRLSVVRNAGAPLIIAGSTHHPEEKLLLQMLSALWSEGLHPKLILAPRHIRRSESIERLCAARRLRSERWSDLGRRNEPWEVLILDEIGWLSTLYGYADLAVIGGTFAEKGGHNAAEAVRHGLVAVVGPSVTNFGEMIGELERAGGIVRTTERELTTTIAQILRSGPGPRQSGSGGRAMFPGHPEVPSRYATEILARSGLLKSRPEGSQAPAAPAAPGAEPAGSLQSRA